MRNNRRVLVLSHSLHIHTTQFLVCTMLLSLLQGTIAAAQTPATKKQSTGKKDTNIAKSIASLEAEAAKYQELLKDIDVKSDPEIGRALYGKWADATCQGKKLKLQQLLGSEDAYTGESVYNACMERLHNAEAAALSSSSAAPPQPTPAKQPAAAATPAVSAASTGPPCSLERAPETASGSNTIYAYTIKCTGDVKPNAIAISMAKTQPAITDAQGKAFAQGFASAMGITLSSYDSIKSIIGFTFPPGANPQTFELLVPTASTQLTSATYFIASGSVKDATTCQASSPAAGCSIDAILVPIPNPKPATTCPNELVDLAVATPTLNAIEVGSDSATGTVPKATSGRVQLCSGTTLVGAPATVGADGKFKVTLPKVTSGEGVTAQFTNADNVSGPPSTPQLLVGSCLADQTKSLQKPTLTRSADSTGKITYTGTVQGAKSGSVRICVDGLPTDKTASVQSDGSFTVSGLEVKTGHLVQAQAVNPPVNPTTFGPVSDPECSAIGTGDVSTMPTLKQVEVGSQTVSGNVSNKKSGTVRVCVGDTQVTTAPIDENGNFTAALPKPLGPGNGVVAQLITSPPGTFPIEYALQSKEAKPKYAYSDFTASFVGGVEESGFSSQGLNTNGFLSAYAQSEYYGKGPVSAALWGRIRLLSGPLPSNVNVVAALTNPSGTITTSNLTNVGQVTDYVVGPELRVKQWDRLDGNTERISFFGGVGATTPLASNQLQYSLTAPPNNSQQCFQLVSLYPVYLANGAANPKTNCTLVNPVTQNPIMTISFAPEGRSNFLVKYAAGFRFTHIFPGKGNQADYAGSVDLSVGQDQEITGGRFQGMVFRIDAVYPLALGASPYLYLFGTASMKTTGNMNSAPIILSTASSVTVPSTSVAVLPLTQPNRDFYRFGVGLNISAIFCYLSKTGCSKTSGTTTTANSTVTPTSAPSTTTTTGAGTGAAADKQ
jgi:hypothetical protein